MTRLAVFSTMVLALSAAPAAAANCFWSNGAYKCYDRAGRIYITKPRVDSDRAYRHPREFGAQTDLRACPRERQRHGQLHL